MSRCSTINVTTLAGRSEAVEVGPSASVGDLKRKISLLAPENQRLYFRGALLGDNAAELAECGLSDGARVNLVAAMRGGGFSPGKGKGKGDGGKGKGGKGGGKGKGDGKGGKGKGGKGKGGKGKGKGKGKGGAKQVVVKPHRHEGVYIASGKEDVLVTRNLAVGDSVYGEKRIAVEEGEGEEKTKIEYRVWNPFRSKLAAAILGGVDSIWMKPGSKVLYLGAASGTSVSHVSDLVGETGCVYAVEFSHRSGRDLINVAKKRTNIIPIIEDARHPQKYRMLVGMVDCIFADVAQPDQARIVALNAALFLKNEGHSVISIKARSSRDTPESQPRSSRDAPEMHPPPPPPPLQLTLEPYERDHAVVVSCYRQDKSKKQKTS
ncbi:hypothetical protein EMIHUDRAFT_350745 [Emiliania huxleyi CCMP1516]|uniref:rRNA 2'-O-methyltransferase fibrillarin n=2 Tax=Emiliania huxleyi TaxID=2903 RepID=A0A0D3I713_EMIH1|nr:hypothetical protein EMIHUDRAFT_350745 [Emiliania huxleyi CCMP1516]EOD07048.1 hypothetical protein EMIHUDRAFT_350745 [Emiliania huxleyi CCMP1516]|eukprot:XP_005759477.1 hypothetical protein EMIHUDRAFT_350745 [Emiliania huxleyi CCMP1516]